MWEPRSLCRAGLELLCRMLFCSDWSIQRRWKTDVDISAEERIRETLSLVCNWKLGTIISIAFLAAECDVMGRQVESEFQEEFSYSFFLYAHKRILILRWLLLLFAFWQELESCLKCFGCGCFFTVVCSPVCLSCRAGYRTWSVWLFEMFYSCSYFVSKSL